MTVTAASPARDDLREFVPADYLREYYAAVGPENDALLGFFARAYADAGEGRLMLEFGCGPTLYPLFSAAPHCRQIDVADYLPANRAVIGAWRAGAVGHDWGPFVRRALEWEGQAAVTPADIVDRVQLLRSRLGAVLACDALRDPVLSPPVPRYDIPHSYDIVGTNFVAESITDDRGQWARALARIASLVAPGGRLVLSALEGATHWRSGRHIFPAVSLTRDEILGRVEAMGFEPVLVEEVEAEVAEADHDDHAGYRGMVLVSATKR